MVRADGYFNFSEAGWYKIKDSFAMAMNFICKMTLSITPPILKMA
jgi:hypothetical protein